MQTKELSLSVAGRPLPIGTTATNVHLLAQNDDSTIELDFFNSDTVDRWVEIAYNGYGAKVIVPAGDSKHVGPFMIAGRAGDGTAVSNKNLILTAEVGSSKLQVMGQVS